MTDTSPSDYAILYVDDEEMALKYFRRFVGREFTVHTAVSVDEALEILAREGEAIGVLITDQRMPGQSGVDLLKKVRLRWPNIVRLLTTAYADLEDAIEAVNRGEIFRYLTKPWDTQTLRTEMRQAMEMFRLRHERAALMREKMSVWQRLVQLGRLRDLVVMARSLQGLRDGDHAVVAYLEEHLTANDTAMTDAARLDLWGVTEAEIGRSLTVVAEIREAVDQLSAVAATSAEPLSMQEFAERAAPQGLDIAFDGKGLPEVCVEASAIDPLSRALVSVTAAEGDGRCVSAVAAEDGVALSWTQAASAEAFESSALLIVYLIAYHHGGRLTCESGDDRRTYRMVLPSQPRRDVHAPLEPGWLESLLVRLEGWE